MTINNNMTIDEKSQQLIILMQHDIKFSTQPMAAIKAAMRTVNQIIKNIENNEYSLTDWKNIANILDDKYTEQLNLEHQQ